MAKFAHHFKNRKEYQRWYQRQYYHTHHKEMLKKRREYYHNVYSKNPDRKRKHRQYIKKYRHNHPDKMHKYNRNISKHERYLKNIWSAKWRKNHRSRYLKSMYRASTKIFVNRYASRNDLKDLIKTASKQLHALTKRS